jgi:hypothetical protein
MMPQGEHATLHAFYEIRMHHMFPELFRQLK